MAEALDPKPDTPSREESSTSCAEGARTELGFLGRSARKGRGFAAEALKMRLTFLCKFLLAVILARLVASMLEHSLPLTLGFFSRVAVPHSLGMFCPNVVSGDRAGSSTLRVGH